MRLSPVFLIMAVLAAGASCNRTDPPATQQTTPRAASSTTTLPVTPATRGEAHADASDPPSTFKTVFGTLARIDGADLMLTLDNAPSYGDAVPPTQPVGEITVKTDARTYFNLDAESASFKDLAPGMRLSITTDPGSPPQIAVVASSKSLMGVFVQRGNNSIVVRVKRQPVTVATDDQTTVVFMSWTLNGQHDDGGRGTLADLKPGMHVNIVPDTGTARKIIAKRPALAATAP